MRSLLRISLPVSFFALCFSSSLIRAQLIPTTDGTQVYDAVNNITWIADFNLPASNRFGIPVCSGTNVGIQTCVNASGSMNYGAAAAWVAAMNAANYLGHNNWQLPTTPLLDNTCGKTGPNGQSFGFGCTAGALDTVYNNLGLKPPNTAVPIPANTAGPFSNVQPYLYWSQSVSSAGASSGNATFSFATGWQGANTLPNFLYLWPMIPGKLPGTPAATGTSLQVDPGGATVYDPVTNITWLANANLAATNAFGLPLCTSPTTPSLCVAQDGAMTWSSAVQYIANMNTATYLGQTNWQAPTISTTCPGYSCYGTDNPMGNLFYNQLGLVPGAAAVATPNIPLGPFKNLQPYLYWSCVGNTIQSACQSAGPAPNFEQSYSFGAGFQGTDLLANTLFVNAYFVGAPANLCFYSLSSGGQAFTATGGTGTFAIITSPTCTWTVSGLPTWVTLTSPASGTGNGTVTFEISPDMGADLTATLNIAGATYFLQLQSSTIPGLNYVGSMPHLAAEGGWVTTFTFVNKSTTTATTRTNFFSPTGGALQLPITLPQQPINSVLALYPQPIVVGVPLQTLLSGDFLPGAILASSLDQTIAPNAQFIMQAYGPAPTYLEGSAQLNATGTEGTGAAVDGFAIFHFSPNNQEAVVPMETRNAASYVLAFDNTSNVLTGVALENVSAQSVTIPFVFRDSTGAQMIPNSLVNPPAGGSGFFGPSSITLPPFGHTSFVLSTQFPLTSNIRGTVEFDTPTGGQISALGIRYTGGTLTTIPVLANVSNTGGLMAHLASGAGWQTTFALVNTGSTSASATLNFYADGGSPLFPGLSFPQTGTALATRTATYTQSIAPGASLWILASDPATSPLLTGSAQLTTSGQVSGYAIFRYNPNGQEAVVPIESRNASSYMVAFDNTGGTVTGLALSLSSAQNANVPVILRNDAGVQVGTSSISLNANGHTSFTVDAAHGYPAAANIRGTLEFATPAGAEISVLGIRSPPALTFTTLPALAK